jgi:transposase
MATIPSWALAHKKQGTEIKYIRGHYYLYAIKSKYCKETKRTKKISLGILGKITENEGFIPSKAEKTAKNALETIDEKQIFALEYGFSKWLFDFLSQKGTIDKLKTHFPNEWRFIVAMIYVRVVHRCPLKNVPFFLSQSNIGSLLGLENKLNDQKICDKIFEIGQKELLMQSFIQPNAQHHPCVLIDATDIISKSNMAIAQRGYNAHQEYHPQFVLLYMYDAESFEPIYYRLLPGNIRDVSILKNTIYLSGIQHCIFIADKGFYSASNLKELEQNLLEYIIPLKRDHTQLDYELLQDIETSGQYFEFEKRFIFHTKTLEVEKRKIELFLDGKLKEQEKNDYLSRTKTLPDEYTKEGFAEKVKKMGTLALIHNTDKNPENTYIAYKNRGEIEQFFDHFKNTLEASCSYMQRDESLRGWMFINHLCMQVIYELYKILKTTPLNKTQKLNHKYSIKDVIEHLKSVQIIHLDQDKTIVTELNKATKTLLAKMKISVT